MATKKSAKKPSKKEKELEMTEQAAMPPSTPPAEQETAITEEQGIRLPRKIFRDGIQLSNGKIAKLDVVEFEPQIRMCKFNMYGKQDRHYLAMPFMQFTRYWGRYGVSLHVSFTPLPLQSIHDPVFFPPLPNIWYPSLQCCLQHCPSPSFQDMMAYFWNTRYLDCEDWYAYPVLDKETPMRSYKRWEQMTKEDPTFILDVEWTHPCLITEIPHTDNHLPASYKCNPEYGGTDVNRHNNDIRSFAVVRNGGSADF